MSGSNPCFRGEILDALCARAATLRHPIPISLFTLSHALSRPWRRQRTDRIKRGEGWGLVRTARAFLSLPRLSPEKTRLDTYERKRALRQSVGHALRQLG